MPVSAQVYSVPVAYCDGRLVAEQFETAVTPGAMGRADYSVRLVNQGSTALNVRLQFMADALNKPLGEQVFAARARRTVSLGYAMNMASRPPLRGQQVADALRVSCR